MSFIDNQKIVGYVFLLVGILEIIGAIVSIWKAFDQDSVAGYLIVAIGALISALIYFFFANKVISGVISGKLNVLGNYVNVVGVTSVIGGIFVAIGGFIIGDVGEVSRDVFVGTGVFSVILGLIIMFMAKKIMDGKETTIDKIIWIILLIVFILMLIGGIGSIISSPVDAICSIVISIFMICYLFDEEVKKAMGM